MKTQMRRSELFEVSVTALLRAPFSSLKVEISSRFQLLVILVPPSTSSLLAMQTSPILPPGSRSTTSTPSVITPPSRTSLMRTRTSKICSMALGPRGFAASTVVSSEGYNTSYAVVDFETVEDAKAAFKMFQGRKAYLITLYLYLNFP